MTHEQFLVEIPIKPETAALKVFEGRYKFQFKEDVDSFLNVVAEENLLRAKEPWSAFPMNFSPVTDNEFYCFQMDFPIRFKMDEAGEVSKLGLQY